MLETVLLVDGNALVHRAFHALPPLTTRKGELVNAVYGFATMLLKAIADLKPQCVAVAFDLPTPTFRHKEFEAYKAQRAKGPEELHHQFRRVRELVAALNMPTYQVEGFEADDVLGTLSKQAVAQDYEVVILTGDADAFQLVSPSIRVLAPRKGVSDTVLYDVAAVRERYGIEPGQIPDLKALVGDTSDNIPGVPGVGEKTAAKLLHQFGNVQGIVDRVAQIEGKQRSAIEAHVDQIMQSKRLATIVSDVPVTFDPARSRVGHYDREQALHLLRELEFRSLLNRLPVPEVLPITRPSQPAARHEPSQMQMFEPIGGEDESARGKAEQPEGNYTLVDTWEALDDLITRLVAAPTFAIDTETDNVEEMQANLVGISFAVRPREAFYVAVGHLSSPKQLALQGVLERLRPVLEDTAKPKCGHNIKYDMTVLARHGVELRGVNADTMLAAYILQATQRAYGLKDLAFSKLGVEMTPIGDLIGSGKKQISMAEVAVERVVPYACADADMTLRLMRSFEPELKQQGLWSLFREVEVPLVSVLSRMERAGILLDVPYLLGFSKELQNRIAEIESSIFSSVGQRFNINSTQQLAQVLFSQLQLGAKRKTKVGDSTAADVLESLRGSHPVVDMILEYRQLVKLKSTYVDALPQLLNRETGRLHTSFNQTGTVTGRLSSADPNLQNIPIRTELGRQVRRAFVSKDDTVLLSADYSQIELRVLAHISRDPRLSEAFAQGKDIHAATAHEIFAVPLDQVTSDMRRMAKTINFGVVYGISDYGLAERIGMPRRDAAEFIQKYLDRYEGVRGYVQITRKQAEEQGFVATVLGRRRAIPEIHVTHRGAREAALRTAINAPIQGTAADIIKLAMIHLDQAVVEQGLRSKMLLQVHDELVFEVPRDELGQMTELVKREMECALSLDVPITVDVKTGRNWAEMD